MVNSKNKLMNPQIFDEQAIAKIMEKRGEFVNILLEKSYKAWQLKIMNKYPWIKRSINLQIRIQILPRVNDFIREEIRIMQGDKEKAKGIFSYIYNAPRKEITRINSKFTQQGKNQGIHISNVDRGITISNTSKVVALEQVARRYNISLDKLFPMLIELKCNCKLLIHKYDDFPDQSEKCEHGLYFVQYLGDIIQ